MTKEIIGAVELRRFSDSDPAFLRHFGDPTALVYFDARRPLHEDSLYMQGYIFCSDQGCHRCRR